MQRLVQGLTSLPRIQLVHGQTKLPVAPQTTLKPIAPRLATSTTTVPRPQIPAQQIQIISSGPRDGTQVLPYWLGYMVL